MRESLGGFATTTERIRRSRSIVEILTQATAVTTERRATMSEATTLEARVQELFEREAIRELKARYFRFADEHDWDAWRQVFTDDLHVEMMDGAPIDGADTFVEFIRGTNDSRRTRHHGHNPELTIDGPTEAHGRWALSDYLEWPADPETGERRTIHGYGGYEETYRKVDGAWKIASMRLSYRSEAPPRTRSTRRAAGATSATPGS
jgi:SnoaL-like domain